MLISYPTFMMYWHNGKKGICGILDYVSDVSKAKYGYNIEGGQRIYRIAYYDGHHHYQAYRVAIDSVTEEGIILADWMERTWRTDAMAQLGLVQEDGKAHCPWKLEGYELVIEPFETLYEDYKLEGLINGTTPKWCGDGRGEGYWYQHGGWRHNSIYEINFQHLMKLQREFDLEG